MSVHVNFFISDGRVICVRFSVLVVSTSLYWRIITIAYQLIYCHSIKSIAKFTKLGTYLIVSPELEKKFH